jgi:hypothetical protein
LDENGMRCEAWYREKRLKLGVAPPDERIGGTAT